MDWFLGRVGLVTLALGAIGIINIMLVAVGPHARDLLPKPWAPPIGSILFQFFLEGAFLTLLSGGVGVGGAMLIIKMLSEAMPPVRYPQGVPVSAIGRCFRWLWREWWPASIRRASRRSNRWNRCGRNSHDPDLLKEAYGAMQHDLRRTTLTMLGMAWGIATVVILLAFGSGFERAITGDLQFLGHRHDHGLPRAHFLAGGRGQGRHRSPPETLRRGLHPQRSADDQGRHPDVRQGEQR